MPIGDICSRDIAIVKRDDTAMHAIKLMREQHAEDVVVIEENAGKLVPVGLVTEHDLLCSVVALELDPKVITMDDIMQPQLVTVKEDSDELEVLNFLNERHQSRLTVVGKEGELLGIITLNDLYSSLVQERGLNLH